MIRSRIVGVVVGLAALSLATACVSRDRYDEVVKERETLRSQNTELAQRNRALKTRLGNTNADMLALSGKLQAERQTVRELEAAREQLAEELSREVDAGLIAVRMMESGVEVRLSENVLFGSGQADVSDRGQAVLARVAARLKEIPYQVVVGGYTDDVPIGGRLAETYPTNWDLAAARAARVVDILETGGVPGHRMVAVSFGENNPIADNANPDGRALNRRIAIRIRPVIPEP